MNYFNLNEEESEIEKALEKGDFTPVKNEALAKKLLKKVASYTLLKNKNINIRLPQKTILKLKAKALAEGMPYQTLISSVLYKYANR